jgi:DNA-binding transcriptional LysR family regulator
MDLDQLHTFLEIVRLKSFSKAAETCFRTQPAISAQIRQLEQELNTTLFDRLGTRIALTAAGRIFAEYAEQILDLRRRAQDAINELERVPRGALMIAANEATCMYVLPGVFAEFNARFPNVQLLLERLYGAKVVQAVLENQADFGFTQLPVQERKLQAVKVHTDQILCILPPGHPLAEKEAISCQDLVGHPLLLPKTGNTRAKLNAWFELVEDLLHISMELDSTELMKRFVMAGLGIAFVAESHCREEVQTGRLVGRPLAPEPLIRQVGMIYRKDKALSRAALGFIDVVLEQSAQGALAAAQDPKRSAGRR